MATPSQRCIHYSEIKNFGTQLAVHPIPDLTILQTSSYKNFLQEDANPRQRKDQGLEAVLREIFPIESYDKKVRLEYICYELEKPRYEPDECRQLRLTYGKPFKIRLRLVKENETTKQVEAIEEDAYLGDLPIMLGGGEFIINGAERVVVSQLHRSPGIDFVSEVDAERKSFSCRVIPERGSWIEVQISRKEAIVVRIDQSSKLPVMMLLRAMSPDLSSDADIIRVFYKTTTMKIDGKDSADLIEGRIAVGDIAYPNGSEKAGDVIVESGQPINKSKAETISTSGIKSIEVMDDPKNRLLLNSLDEDKSSSHEEALLRIYQRLRPGNPPQIDKAKDLFRDKFLDTNRYRLGRVGRFRIYRKLGLYEDTIKAIKGMLQEVVETKKKKLTDDEKSILKTEDGKSTEKLEFLNFSSGNPPVFHERFIKEFNLSDIEIEGLYATVAEIGIQGPFAAIEREKLKIEDEKLKNKENVKKIKKFNETKSLFAMLSEKEVAACVKDVKDFIKRHKEDLLNDLASNDPLMTLQPNDIIKAIFYLNRLWCGDPEAEIDDIDHLGNRRLRTIDELASEEIRKGFLKLRRTVQERMSLRGDDATPRQVINQKSISAAIEYFFGRGELSQVVDQTNPLSMLTHERRLSALGPGGLNRKRAGFDVRDVHSSHYGRICPIETPEGTNIGLISSLSIYAGVDEFGFLISPYRMVEKGILLDEIKWLRADEEHETRVAPADVEIEMCLKKRIAVPGESGEKGYKEILVPVKDESGTPKGDEVLEPIFSSKGKLLRYKKYKLKGEELLDSPDEKGKPRVVRAIIPDEVTRQVIVRYMGDYDPVDLDDVQAVDVSPSQMIGVSAGLIPFLEHDDANRALMGSNMQRQAVPLLIPEPPLVATGMEKAAAYNSALLVHARKDGTVTYCDGQRIIINDDDRYDLRKFVGLNERTCQNQVPIVRVGDVVKKGDILADGASMKNGELCLGRNVLVAFMVWDGYNFEDAIIISEDLVKKDTYTSIHIEEFDTEIRDTKLGREEFTRDIPNVGERALRNLDETGIVRVGTFVRPGDILVGKVTPKSKTELTPEEKLLHAIFGRAGEDVKNESLEVPSGVEGIVIGTQKFSCRMSLTEDERKQFDAEISKAEEDGNRKISETFGVMIEEMERVLDGQLTDEDGVALVHDQKYKFIAEQACLFRLETFLQNGEYSQEIASKLTDIYNMKWHYVESAIDARDRRLNSMKRGDELRRGVLQMVKVYIAAKRVVSVGDKMAGRHGNKGVIAKVLPREDMPFLEDGTPVEIMLNPLGVPSRMNVGQILETHLGWAAAKLGYQAVTPVFDGATEEQINDRLETAGLPKHGKVKLYDGRTGEPFEQETTVGYIYMLKLHHLVDDKVHARSTGPYSLITQQPLGGKARFGGQRFGEMEVWALEAYGAAYTLQELLTVKSDDVEGRTKIYESMVKGENTLEAGTPASFDVLTNEIRGLALNMQLEKSPYSRSQFENDPSPSFGKRQIF